MEHGMAWYYRHLETSNQISWYFDGRIWEICNFLKKETQFQHMWNIESRVRIVKDCNMDVFLGHILQVQVHIAYIVELSSPSVLHLYRLALLNAALNYSLSLVHHIRRYSYYL